MEQSFELRLGTARTLEKGPVVNPIELGEYDARKEARSVEIASARRAVEQARNTLARVTAQTYVEKGIAPAITAEMVQGHLEAVKERYSIEHIMRVLVPDTAGAYVRAAIAMYIPGTREYAAHKLYLASELIGESYLEPHKLGQAERILANLESKLN